MNIVNNLKELNCEIPIIITEEEIIHAENIDRDLETDFIIFASKHQSQKPEKTLSIHTIGNFNEAKYGGKPSTLSKASANITKHFFKILNNLNTSNYKLTLEATHHGPSIETPSIFIEIGSTTEEWNDKEAGAVIAKTIIEATSKKIKKHKEAFAVGGPHYCPNFNEIQLNSDYAISFIAPKHALPLSEDIVKQLINQTIEKPKIAIIDWKGLGTATQKNETLNLLKEEGIEIIKTRDAKPK